MTALVAMTAGRRVSPGITALLALLLLGLFDLRVLSTHAWDPAAFILKRDPARPLETGWGIGYDGQWYYEIALDPLGAAPRLDQPAYRYQRPVFPLLVHVLSLGRTAWIPWTMILVNLAAAVAGCGLLAALLQQRGASPLMALVLPLSVGYLFSVRANLLEPLALTFALAGFWSYERRRIVWSLVFFGIAGLTKEMALAFPLSVALWELAQAHWRRVAILVGSTLGPYLIWSVFLSVQLGHTAKSLEQSRPTLLPFSGLGLISDPPSLVLVLIWVIVPTLLGGGLAIWRTLRQPTGAASRDAYLVIVHVALIATLPGLTWIDPLAVLRVASGMLVALLIWLAASYPRGLGFLAALWGPSGLILALVPGMI